MARDIDIGNGAITNTNTSPEGEIKRIRRLLEVIAEEEVTQKDVED